MVRRPATVVAMLAWCPCWGVRSSDGELHSVACRDECGPQECFCGSFGSYTWTCGSEAAGGTLTFAMSGGKARLVYEKAEPKAQTLVLDHSPHIFLHHDAIASAMSQNPMGFTPNIDLHGFQLDWASLKK